MYEMSTTGETSASAFVALISTAVCASSAAGPEASEEASLEVFAGEGRTRPPSALVFVVLATES